MLNLPLSVLIEGLVAILLVITIGYCVLLNARLKRLRADEEGLRATIAELLTATEIAERAIQGLRTTSAQCDQTLGQRLHEAKTVSDALATRLTAASAVVERLGKVTGAVRGLSQSASVADSAGAGGISGNTVKPADALDDAARALQERLSRVAS